MDLGLFSRVRNYDATDHLFIFLSLIYAFAITYSIDNIVEFCNYFSVSIELIFKPANASVWPELQRMINNIMALLWNMLALSLSIESWWTVWLDKNEIADSFVNFLLIICYPILLSVDIGLISKLILTGEKFSIPFEQYAFFFMVAAFLLAFLAFLRKKFDKFDKSNKNFILRIYFAILLALVSILCGLATFVLKQYSLSCSIILFSFSFACLSLGSYNLWRFITKNRNNHFRIYKLSKDMFFEKIQLIASLPYRHFFSFGFIVVELKKDAKDEIEKKCMGEIYKKAYELILNNTRRYYICAFLIKRIVLFIPYIDSMPLDQKSQNDYQRIDNLLKIDPKLQGHDFIIEQTYGTFEKEEIDAIGSDPQAHLEKLEKILEAKYDEAVTKINLIKEN